MSVCFPRGFRASGIAAGIKASGAPDLAIVACDGEAPTAAAAFTRNHAAAAPVLLSRAHVANGRARAVVISSGNANACTGAQGDRDAHEMAELTGRALGCNTDDVLVCSTGVIGHPLPMAAIRAALPLAVGALAGDGGMRAAEAIRTTDAFNKVATREVGAVRIGAMAKGAGMIRPNVATMIVVVTTDAAVEPGLLRRLLGDATRRSLNLVSVDGSESTNDTVCLLASGASGVTVDEHDCEDFAAALRDCLLDLGKQMVRDGEGASRFAHYVLRGARSDEEAEIGVRAVGEDLLVRCALHGADPNWGRMMARLGSCGIELDHRAVSIRIGGAAIVEHGLEQPQHRPTAHAAMRTDEVAIEIDLALGCGRSELYASSLTPAYVEFNAEYST